MQLSTMSNPYASTSAEVENNYKHRKLIGEEIELRDRSEVDISPWWKIISVAGYFVIVCSGIATSISIGSLLAAFQNKCIFYGKMTIKGLDEKTMRGNWTLFDEDIINEDYGKLYDCTFCEYCSVASTIFGGVWGVMFLQCGRGGATRRSLTQSWIIVPPALMVDIVFFVLSVVIFTKTTGGLSYFCAHLKSEEATGADSVNVTTCKQIMHFHFPEDLYNTNLYYHYIVAQVGSFTTFLGWLIVLFVLILRCFIPVDFVVYGRKQYQINSFHADHKRKNDASRIRTSSISSTSYEVVTNSPSISTTSFITTSGSSRSSTMGRQKLGRKPGIRIVSDSKKLT